MKLKIYLFFLLIGFTVFAQDAKNVPCLTQNIMDQLIKENPEVKHRLDMMDKQITSAPAARSDETLPLITIPVVVYVVHGGVNNPENIGDAQVTSQIVALNDYFADYGLKFCLATRAGAGTTSIPLKTPASDVQTTPGIIHVQNATLTNHIISQWPSLEATAHLTITRDRYLRIWVVKSIENSSIKGYAMFPNTSSFDGVVMKYDVFGKTGCTNCNLDPLFLQGKTLVHEVGHYLGLYHTFHEGCSEIGTASCTDNGDRVCDTPPSEEANYSCLNMDSCTADTDPDDVLNYMDYGNECSSHFTEGQQERMVSTLNTQRQQLITYSNLIYTGACGILNPISSNFTADRYTVCANTLNPVQFTAEAQTNVTYSWDFGDGSVYSSTLNTASHLYSSITNSPYTVTLTVVNAATNEQAFSQTLIFVTNCSPINNSDSRWFVGTNNMLDFSSGLPVFDQAYTATGIGANTTAIQNDTSGNLLFYTDKRYVYDSSYVKTNPTTPLVLGGAESLYKNSVLILPKPGSPSQYYIFTNKHNAAPDDMDNGLRYSIINSNGTLSSTVRIPVTFPSSSGFITDPTDGALSGGTGIAAIQKSDGYWIITSLMKNSVDHYLVVYNLTQAGLVYKTSIQYPSSVLDGINNVKASPNGNKIAVSADHSYTYIYDFNKITGLFLTSPLQLKNGSFDGLSFSPDSNLVYVSDDTKVYQFNLSVRSTDNNKIEIGNLVNLDVNGSLYSFGQIQEGPDGKLYVTSMSGSKELAVIHMPNAAASVNNPNACFFSMHGPKNATNNINTQLPNIINAKNATVYNNTISYYPMGCGSYRFFPNIVGTTGTSTFSWVFKNTFSNATVTLSATNTCPTRTFTPGPYSVEVKNGTTVLATINITVEAMADPVILGSDFACSTSNQASHNSVVLENGENAVWAIIGGGGTIQGLNDQPEVSIAWESLPGTISLTITNENGCTKTVTKIIQSSCTAGANDYVEVVKNRGNQKYYFAGNFTQYNGVTRNKIARLNIDMSLDETFDAGVSADNSIDAMAIQNDDKAVIGGWFTEVSGQPKSGIARLTSSGALDPTFLGTGFDNVGAVNAIEIQNDLKIVVGGVFDGYNGEPAYSIVRINLNGSKDPTFDATQLSGLDFRVYSLAIQSDHRIIVGGFSAKDDNETVIVRLNTNGSIDNTFTPFVASSGGIVTATKIMQDGKILIGGKFIHSEGGNTYNNFLRLNSDGTLDTTFFPIYIGVTGNGPGVRAIEIQSDGKIIIGGGFMWVDEPSRNGIARLTSTGQLDGSFDPGQGFLANQSAPYYISSSVASFALHGDKLVVGGSFNKYNEIFIDNITKISMLSNDVIGRPADQPILEEQKLEEIVVYPNPVKDYVTISSSDVEMDTIEIYNAIGQVIKSQKVVKGENIILLQQLSEGIYMLKILNKGKILKINKIIKN